MIGNRILFALTIRACCVLSLGLQPGSASLHAAVYHLDPSTGRNSNPGTAELPFGSLESVAASSRRFQAGDRLVLHDGHHGSPVINQANSGEVIVEAQSGARPTLRNLTLQSARYWTVRGLEISPQTAPTYGQVVLVNIGASSDIRLEDCLIYSEQDSQSWTVEDWKSRACTGIKMSGTRNVLRNNRLRNVNFGIDVGYNSVSNLVQGNVIENFAADAIRGLSDFCTFEYNIVKNSYRITDNHDDGFQSWSMGPQGPGSGVVRGVVLRGNQFINHDNPNQREKGTLQGIGCFDGFYEDWVVENNVVMVDHWHGITFQGARNCRIINNTVVDINGTAPGPPWIQIGPHKDGRPSTGNVVRNNLSTAYRIEAGVAVMDHNQTVSDYSRYFADYAGRNLALRPGAPAIDAGATQMAPLLDILGARRPWDGDGDGQAAIDLGAYEYGAAAGAEPQVSAPRFSPSGGFRIEPVTVTMACPTEGAMIRYTLDGSDPTPDSALYSGPLRISASTLLTARGFLDGRDPSTSTTARYDFGPFVLGSGWSHAPFEPRSNRFTIVFDVTPLASDINAVFGFAEVTGEFSSLAASVRFAPTGQVDARNGSFYEALSSLAYEPGRSYRVAVGIDLEQGRYSVHVTPTGSLPVLIAGEHRFRDGLAVGDALGVLSWLSVDQPDAAFLSNPVIHAGVMPPAPPRQLDAGLVWQ